MLMQANERDLKVWRWLVHKLMRDLRVVATTEEWPDIESDNDDRAIAMRNLIKVMEKSNEPLEITERMWHSANMSGTKGRDREVNKRKVQELARDTVLQRWRDEEKDMSAPHLMSPAVWGIAMLALCDSIYEEEFQDSGANAYIGDWNHPSWKRAMTSYRLALREQLPDEWQIRLKDVDIVANNNDDEVAVREAETKLAWVQRLQVAGLRELNAPFICDRFLKDVTKALSAAEGGLKLVSVILFTGVGCPRDSGQAAIAQNLVGH